MNLSSNCERSALWKPLQKLCTDRPHIDAANWYKSGAEVIPAGRTQEGSGSHVGPFVAICFVSRFVLVGCDIVCVSEFVAVGCDPCCVSKLVAVDCATFCGFDFLLVGPGISSVSEFVGVGYELS